MFLYAIYITGPFPGIMLVLYTKLSSTYSFDLEILYNYPVGSNLLFI